MKLFRFRKQKLPWPAALLLLFLLLVGAALVWQLLAILGDSAGIDWLLLSLVGTTLLLFVIIGLAVFFLDFEQKLVLLRDGIYIMPAVFAAYKVRWEDIERLELREGNGFRLIEYRLKSGTPSYEACVKRSSLGSILATEGRTGGFHGAIPAQAYPMDVAGETTEQNNIRANRLYPVLRRFWTNPAARAELPEVSNE